jgi:hypothetical protein
VFVTTYLVGKSKLDLSSSAPSLNTSGALFIKMSEGWIEVRVEDRSECGYLR